eukprot:720049-Pelagomonas_calceolata.AAC.4
MLGPGKFVGSTWPCHTLGCIYAAFGPLVPVRAMRVHVCACMQQNVNKLHQRISESCISAAFGPLAPVRALSPARSCMCMHAAKCEETALARL